MQKQRAANCCPNGRSCRLSDHEAVPKAAVPEQHFRSVHLWDVTENLTAKSTGDPAYCVPSGRFRAYTPGSERLL